MSHLVTGGFPVGQTGDTKVVSRTFLALAVVGSLDNIDELSILTEVGERNQPGFGLEGDFWQR